MRPTDILSSEHRVIEQVLDCLECIAQGARKNQSLDIASAEKAVLFLRTFADACHHGKEEQQLFTALEARGMPTRVGPIAVMLGEHEIGRALIREIDAAISAAKNREAGAPERFADKAHEYVELLRDHIAKEDQVLFPMAESMLTSQEKEHVLAMFEKVEQSHPAGTHQAMEAIARDLASRFGIDASKHSAPLAVGGCCHHASPAQSDGRERSSCGSVRTTA